MIALGSAFTKKETRRLRNINHSFELNSYTGFHPKVLQNLNFASSTAATCEEENKTMESFRTEDKKI